MAAQPSIIKYASRESPGACGYCKGSSGCHRHGLWAYKLSVADYQDLIDHGWRRCGKYCYKPIMKETCCPMYTIRCDGKSFTLSKSQKRLLKRVNRFLVTGDKGSQKVPAENGAREPAMDIEKAVNAERRISAMELPQSDLLLVKEPTNPSANVQSEMCGPSSTVQDFVPEGAALTKSSKAKHKRIQRKHDKLKSLELTDAEIAKKMIEKKRYPVKKTLEDFIDCAMPQNAAHRLEVRLVRSAPRSDEFSETYDAGLELYRKYQVIIHKDPPRKISSRSYDDFLVKSPLEADELYGSYHQQYWLDEELIAVGVIDILPNCVSSVYFFYNPEYAFLSLGTYGALRELHLVRSLTKIHSQLKYYYMGYYIHTCPKMRYKAAFKPSFLLCPEACTWHPIAKAAAKLNSVKYARLNEDIDARDNVEDIDISSVKIFHKKRLLGGGSSSHRNLAPLLREYIYLVGTNCASRMIMWLD